MSRKPIWGTPEMETLIQQCVNALSLGGTYALLALGLAVVFSVLGMINFAHGEILTIAGYTVFFSIISAVPPILIIPLAWSASPSAPCAAPVRPRSSSPVSR
jgi:branched-chain amino acid transport system permease protein